ncbi:hypothetical protein KR018_012651, partial [Drosophila ironensis]
MTYMLLETPIVSIYDMMMERQRASIRESSKKAGRAVPGLRKLLEDREKSQTAPGEVKRLMSNKSSSMEASISMQQSSTSPYCLSPKNTSGTSSKTITASHLTKKQTSIKVQPGKREVIRQLVERMCKAVPKVSSEALAMVKQSSPSSRQQLVSARRKKTSGRGNKQKTTKSNSSAVNRLPQPPRKANNSGKTPKSKSESKKK